MRRPPLYLRLAGSSEDRFIVKILLVTGSFPPGRCGVGDYSFRLAKALSDEQETRVAVLTSASCVATEQLDRIEIFPLIKKWCLSEIFRVIRITSRLRPDIIHIQYPTQGYGKGRLPGILPLVFFLMGHKVVQTWHESYSRRQSLWVALKAIVPGRLVVVRPTYKQDLHPWLRWMLAARDFVFIQNGSALPKSEIANGAKQQLIRKYVKNQSRLIVFFGFVYPHKRVDLLFDIADPDTDQIVIAGEIREETEYGKLLLRLASGDRWKGRTTITGFLPAAEAANLLAIADAVVLPFRFGGGEWNTSIHGTALQGTFILTTSTTLKGYDVKRNIYYAEPDAVEEMRSALNMYCGKRRSSCANLDGDEWQYIASEHRRLYSSILSK